MAEIVNLKRVKKAKTRAEKTKKAEANRIRHAVPKALRDLEEARAAKRLHDIDARRLDET